MYLTVAEVAQRLGITRERVYVFIAEGRLPAKRLGREWLIREEDLAKLHRLPRGRPKKSGGGA